MRALGEGYRHLNVLVPNTLHIQLMKWRDKTRIPVAQFVRDGIELILLQYEERENGSKV